MKKVLVVLLSVTLFSCSKERRVETGVTGKGNGGDGRFMSGEQLSKSITDVKPQLKGVFEGLRDLARAEVMKPGFTDLSEFPRLLALIIEMTSDRNKENVFTDIDTKDNLNVVEGSCVDKKGKNKLATAVPGEVGGKICFSLKRLSQIAPKDATLAVDILILGMAAHEFSHHYMTGDDVEDEKLAKTLQDFVNFQLYNFTESNGSVLSFNRHYYVDYFKLDASEKLSQVIKRGASK